MHGLVPKNILKLFGGSRHLITPAHGENLCKAAVKEDALKAAIESNEVQQVLIVLSGAGFELKLLSDCVYSSPGCLFGDGRIS